MTKMAGYIKRLIAEKKLDCKKILGRPTVSRWIKRACAGERAVKTIQRTFRAKKKKVEEIPDEPPTPPPPKPKLKVDSKKAKETKKKEKTISPETKSKALKTIRKLVRGEKSLKEVIRKRIETRKNTEITTSEMTIEKVDIERGVSFFEISFRGIDYPIVLVLDKQKAQKELQFNFDLVKFGGVKDGSILFGKYESPGVIEEDSLRLKGQIFDYSKKAKEAKNSIRVKIVWGGYDKEMFVRQTAENTKIRVFVIGYS